MKDVQYFAPATLKEALQLKGKHGLGLKVLAGATDLVRDMNLEFKIPQGVLWVGKLGLEYIRQEDGLIHVGAATRMQTAGASKLLQQKATALAQAAAKMASPPVRSLAQSCCVFASSECSSQKTRTCPGQCIPGYPRACSRKLR